jgi:hypothetical protein
MTIYRYVWGGICVDTVRNTISPSIVFSIAAGPVPAPQIDLEITGVTTPSDKEDLDASMLCQGWNYLATDPLVPL